MEEKKCFVELRKDPTSGRWSVVQKENALRYIKCEKYLVERDRIEFESESCFWSRQFSGEKRQEKETLFGLKWKNDDVEITYDNWHSGDWEVMVVRTDYAQVVPERKNALLGEPPFVAEAGFGIHELIVEDPSEEHLPLGIMNEKRTQLILLAMLYRLKGEIEDFPRLDENKAGKPLMQREGVHHVSFFHNHRKEAGGSFDHPHSQIIASPIIPTDVSAELAYVLKRQEQPPRRCAYCEIIEAELAIRERERENSKDNRILFETEHFIALQPHSSIYLFETWLIPKKHTSSFADIKTTKSSENRKTELEDLSALINCVVGRLYACLDDPGYNLIIKTQPITRPDEPTKYSFSHWHIRIEPRGLTIPAGYELSTGIFTSSTPPEITTLFLQKWGILGESDENKIGTINWYMKAVELAKDEKFMQFLKYYLKYLEKQNEKDSYEKKKEGIEGKIIMTLTAELETRLAELKEEEEKKLGKGIEIKEIIKKRLRIMEDIIKIKYFGDENVKDVNEFYEKLIKITQLQGENTNRDKIIYVINCILSTIQRSPYKIRNILTILKNGAVELKNFARASKLIEELKSSHPELFIMQSEPPAENKQLLQSQEVAGKYDGPHYRRCPSTGRWTLIPGKARRKNSENLKREQEKKKGTEWLPKDSKEECHFCSPKKEENKIICGIKKDDLSPDYSIKDKYLIDLKNLGNYNSIVIENKAPILTLIEQEDKKLPIIGGTGPFETIEGIGECEVIVIGLDKSKIIKKDGTHNYLVSIGKENLASALKGVCARVREIKEKNSTDISKQIIKHITIFSNHRGEAGAHVSHLNWQIIASPIIPTEIGRELEHGKLYFNEYSGRCCFCDMIQAELRVKKREKEDETKLSSRIIFCDCDIKNFVTFAPYSSRVPFEVWIMPISHENSIEESLSDDNKINELSKILSKILEALYTLLGDPGYSIIIKNSPIPPPGYEHLYKHYHWRIIIEPQRLAIPAGYEHLTGIWSNVIPPEKVAEELNNFFKLKGKEQNVKNKR